MGKSTGKPENRITVDHGIRIDVYRPLVECGNCGLFQKVPINYGELVCDANCPNCKCTTLRLSNKEVPTNFHVE